MEALYHFVWRKNGVYKPRRKHATLEIAMREAERLSALAPDAKFVVLAAVAEIGPSAEGDGTGEALPPADQTEKVAG